MKRRHSLSTQTDVCFSTGRLNQLSRFHRSVDLALLFKKGVGREIAGLKVADNVFSDFFFFFFFFFFFGAAGSSPDFSKVFSRHLASRHLNLSRYSSQCLFQRPQHSRSPFLKFCRRRTAGDLSQSTFCVQNFFQDVSLCSLEVNATLLRLCGSRWRKLWSSHEVSPRLARQCGSQEKQRVQASGSNFPFEVVLNNVRTLGSKSSLKRQTQGRLEGDR